MDHRARAELLVACLGQGIDPKGGSLPGTSLPASSSDWEWFFALAVRHRVLSAVARRLLRPDVELEPELVAKLEALDRCNERLGKSLAETMHRTLEALAAKGIRAMPWGGSAVACLADSARVPRRNWGVELFVDPRRAAESVAVLEGSGFIPWRARPARHVSTWRRITHHEALVEPASGSLVRIDWDASVEHHRFRRSFEELWERSRGAGGAPPGNPVRVPGAVDSLLWFCLKGTEQGWASMSTARDLSVLAASLDGASWDSLTEMATKLGLRRPLRIGLLLADSLCRLEAPEGIRRFMTADLEATGGADEARRRWLEGGKAARKTPVYDTWAGSAAALGRRVFVPTREDFQALPLPLWMSSAYAVLRPGRLLMRAAFGWLRTPGGTDDWPYLGSPPEAIDRMLAIAEVGKSDMVYDLGCGDGRVVIAAARNRGAQGVGVDVSTEMLDRARRSAEAEGVAERVSFQQADAESVDIRRATVVALYLPPAIVLKLRGKLERELPKGARIVAHEVEVPGWRPERVEVVPTERGITQVHLWTIR